MTKKEVLKILAICREVGVQFVNSDNNILIGIWEKSFENNTYEEVSRALFELINSRKGLFLNGLIGEIKAQILASKVDFLDFSTVWEIIRKAAHKTHPDIPSETKNAFNSLPPMIQHLVGSAKHLEEMEYCIDRDKLETIEKSNLKKVYTDMIIESKSKMILGKKPIWEEKTKIEDSKEQNSKLVFDIQKIANKVSLDKNI